MSALNTLKFVSAKRPQSAPPIVQRRMKLSNQLHEQIELARCQADGKTYTPTRLRSIKDKHTGERKLVDAVKRVKQWWFVADSGKLFGIGTTSIPDRIPFAACRQQTIPDRN